MDLKVVGAGVLGVRVALLWKEKHPDAKVYLKTRFDNAERSAKWRAAGFLPLSVEKEEEDGCIKTPFVVFSAPPTDNPNYDQDVAKSTVNDWSRPDQDQVGGAGFVFTSSGGVFVENTGQPVNEESAAKATTKRGGAILAAEEAVLSSGGVAIRMAGLYTRNHGPHNFWLKGGKSEYPSAPNGLINLIHYDDAARIVVAALTRGANASSKEGGKLYIASDGVPISRRDICQASIQCPDYKECAMPTFTGDETLVDGKKYDTTKAKTELEWGPKFTPFAKFMSDTYDEEMSVDLI